MVTYALSLASQIASVHAITQRQCCVNLLSDWLPGRLFAADSRSKTRHAL